MCRWRSRWPLLLLASRRDRRLGIFAGGTILIAYLGYLAIYWIGLPEIHFYLDSSALRIVTPLGVFAAALFPLLLAEALTRRRGTKRAVPTHPALTWKLQLLESAA